MLLSENRRSDSLIVPNRSVGSYPERRHENIVESCYLSPAQVRQTPNSFGKIGVHELSSQRKHVSEISGSLRDLSMSNLEAALNLEMKHPIKKFSGLNNIRMCGSSARLLMGEQPKALIFTGLVINIPATYFNALVATASLWGDYSYGLTLFGIALQLTCTFLMFYTSCVDPGIIPATFISKEARNKVNKKYINIKHKSHRVSYLIA